MRSRERSADFDQNELILNLLDQKMCTVMSYAKYHRNPFITFLE